MSNINLTGLYDENADRGYKYKDIRLDLQEGNNTLPRGLFRESNITDIESSFDEYAILNSIINIFNTSPGEKLLSPTFGLDLRRYLFSPISIDTSEHISDAITLNLGMMEPRVSLDHVNITPDYDENQYIITLYISIPTLNISGANYNGILNTEGFTFKHTDEQ